MLNMTQDKLKCIWGITVWRNCPTTYQNSVKYRGITGICGFVQRRQIYQFNRIENKNQRGINIYPKFMTNILQFTH